MKTALLIDDDPLVRATVAACLSADGWQVLEAADGQSGIELIARHTPAVVLCDLRMPRTNGFQVCRWVRSQGGAIAQTRIIVTAGSDYETDRDGSLAAGADEYLGKPFKPARLLEVVNKLTRSQPISAAAVARLHPRAMIATRVKFWGVRGSIPTPGPATVRCGGNTACVEVRCGSQILVLDGGTGIFPLGQSLVAEFKDQPIDVGVLITHLHWDHIQGLPFFAPIFRPGDHVRLIGFEGSRQRLNAALALQMESPYFPVPLRQLPATISIDERRDFAFPLGQVEVRAMHVNHPDICVGYRLKTPAGDVAYLPDFESFGRMLAHPPANSDTEFRAKKAFAESEDRKVVDFVRGAEVLIMDSQYDATEYAGHRGWGHSCVEDSVDLAIQAEVRRLFLFHHDPAHDDEQVARLETQARQIVAARHAALHVEAAREGVECNLTPTPALSAVEAR